MKRTKSIRILMVSISIVLSISIGVILYNYYPTNYIKNCYDDDKKKFVDVVNVLRELYSEEFLSVYIDSDGNLNSQSRENNANRVLPIDDRNKILFELYEEYKTDFPNIVFVKAYYDEQGNIMVKFSLYVRKLIGKDNDSADKIMYYLVYHDSEYQLDEYMKLADKDGINDNWFIYSEKGYIG